MGSTIILTLPAKSHFPEKKVSTRFTSSDDYSFGPEEGGDWQENCQRAWQLQGNCQSTYREGHCHCQSKLQEEAVVVCWKETRYAVILTLTSTLSCTFPIEEGRGVEEFSPQSILLETWKTCLSADTTQCNVTIKFDQMQCNEGMKNKVNQMPCTCTAWYSKLTDFLTYSWHRDQRELRWHFEGRAIQHILGEKRLVLCGDG